MITRKVMTIDLPDLGQVVELREPAAIDMLRVAQEEKSDDQMAGFRQLALMLWVDGQQYSADDISQWGFSLVGPLFDQMNAFMPGAGTEGNG